MILDNYNIIYSRVSWKLILLFVQQSRVYGHVQTRLSDKLVDPAFPGFPGLAGAHLTLYVAILAISYNEPTNTSNAVPLY